MIISKVYKDCGLKRVMVHVVLFTLLSVILVSLMSLIGIVALLKKDINKWLLSLVSLSAGALLGDSFLHLLREQTTGVGLTPLIGLSVLLGIAVFLGIEKLIHMHHQHTLEQQETHHHAYHFGIMNLVGDGLHNFLDGLIIAGSYLVSLPVGIATTIAVVLHEIPQEIGDFGVLIYSGMSTKKALFFNFLSALVAVVGAVVGLALGNNSPLFLKLLPAFAAGGFIYIAGTNLIPELHKHPGLKESIIHFLMFALGVGLMYGLLFLGV